MTPGAIQRPFPGQSVSAQWGADVTDACNAVRNAGLPGMLARNGAGAFGNAPLPVNQRNRTARIRPNLFEVRWFSSANEGAGGWAVFLIGGYDVYIDGRPVDAIGCEEGQLSELEGDAWVGWYFLPNEVWETGGDLWLNVRIPKPNEETGVTDEYVSAEFSQSEHVAEDKDAWYQSYLIACFDRSKKADGTYNQPVVEQLFVGAIALSSGTAAKAEEGYSGYVTYYGPVRYGLPVGEETGSSRDYRFWQASTTLRYKNGRLIEVTENDEEEICGTTPISEEGLY